jgi:predicted dehydrogenase
MGIAIIGTGWGARVQVPAFRAAGLEVVALAGSQLEKTRHIAADLGVDFATADWRELLTRSDVGLISIVTPPDLHHSMAVAALTAEKHVLCEKPTAMNAAEAEAMLAAAHARPGLLALIDHELRFLPAVRHAKRLIVEGAIGAVRYAENRLVSSGRADPQRPWTWWSDAEQGGGALGAIGSHQVDTLRYLLGEEPVAARGLIAALIAERPDSNGQLRAVTADDSSTFVMQFASGALATATAVLTTRHEEPSALTMYGSEGTLRFTGGELLHAAPGAEFATITPPHSVSFPEGITGDFPQGTVYLGQALRAYFDGDADAIDPAATFADGLANQRVLDAVRRNRVLQ